MLTCLHKGSHRNPSSTLQYISLHFERVLVHLWSLVTRLLLTLLVAFHARISVLFACHARPQIAIGYVKNKCEEYELAAKMALVMAARPCPAPLVMAQFLCGSAACSHVQECAASRLLIDQRQQSFCKYLLGWGQQESLA